MFSRDIDTIVYRTLRGDVFQRGGALWTRIGQRENKITGRSYPQGGSGTRLWPLSRAAHPKFLLPLLGERSLLTENSVPAGGSLPAGADLCGLRSGSCRVDRAASSRKCRTKTFWSSLPREGRSFPAIGLAAALIAQRDRNAVMGSFAADHEVGDIDAFVSAVRTAIAAAANEGWLVTIGLTQLGLRPVTATSSAPTRLWSKPSMERHCVTARFVEKPDLEQATEYVEPGRFLWNASMFIWKAQSLLDEMERQQPELLAGITRIADAWGTPAPERITAEVWSTLPESTIDQGIMERAERVAVVPSEMGWSDVGDWHGLGELIEHDSVGNSVHGDIIQFETSNSVIWSETQRLVALVGLQNTVVVDTEDALLVVDRARAQDVRQNREQLKQLRRHELR